jgi:thiopurine S-methyltransferase
MKRAFWEERWQQRQIGFHEGRPNVLLQRHISRIAECKRVYAPLCGKSVDLVFLRACGHEVIGSELVRSAVVEFFSDLEETATETLVGRFVKHASLSRDLTILEGDAFAIGPEHTDGDVDAIYDRAALVALDPPTRATYVEAILRVLRPEGLVFLITFEYPQDKVKGPPWSVSHADVHALYSERFDIELLEEGPTTGGPKFAAAGVTDLTERAFLLRKKPLPEDRIDPLETRRDAPI